jgi:hypothetical protein
MKHIKLFEELNNKKTVKEIESNYSYFHLSQTLLNNNSSFTFTPRVPSEVYGHEISVIEDDFTKRVSLGKTIEDCLYALPEEEYATWYIYGIKDRDIVSRDSILSVSDMFKNCPTGYGKDFRLLDWINDLPEGDKKELSDVDLDVTTGVSDLPVKYRDMFYGCVPDAKDNDEYWSLVPITMEYLGYIKHDLYNKVNLYDTNYLRDVLVM